MARKRLVVLVSGSGSNLQAIIDASRDPAFPAEVAAVISNRPDAYGLTRAADAGIGTSVIANRDFPDRDQYDAALANAINQYQPDLVVLAGFMRILTPAFVSQFHGRLLNIHPSLLPKFKGLHTHERAIEAGEREAGATVHFVSAELDAGPIIIQASVPVLPGDDAGTLAKRVLEKEHRIYPLAVRWFCEGRLSGEESRVLLDGEPLPATGFQFKE